MNKYVSMDRDPKFFGSPALVLDIQSCTLLEGSKRWARFLFEASPLIPTRTLRLETLQRGPLTRRQTQRHK